MRWLNQRVGRGDIRKPSRLFVICYCPLQRLRRRVGNRLVTMSQTNNWLKSQCWNGEQQLGPYYWHEKEKQGLQLIHAVHLFDIIQATAKPHKSVRVNEMTFNGNPMVVSRSNQPWFDSSLDEQQYDKYECCAHPWQVDWQIFLSWWVDASVATLHNPKINIFVSSSSLGQRPTTVGTLSLGPAHEIETFQYETNGTHTVHWLPIISAQVRAGN